MDNQNTMGTQPNTGGANTPTAALPASDFVDNPSYQAPQAPLAASEFTDNPSYQGSSGTAEMNATSPYNKWESGNPNPNDNAVERGLERASGVIQGAGAGIIRTVRGLANLTPGGEAISDLANRVDPGLSKKISGYLDRLAMTSPGQEQSGAQKVGNWAETLGEFLSGDEAFKGMGVADQLMEQGKIARALEKSPKLMNALRLGVNVSKAAGELSPEELELVKAHPILARLVGAGYDAIRHGTIQGVQTEAKTGDAKQAAKDALEMAGTSGLTSSVLGSIAGAASKTGNAAETAQALSEAAKNAPTPEGVRANVENYINEALNPERAAAEGTLDAAQRDLEGFGTAAPSKESLTGLAQQYAQEAERNYHGAYVNGINGIKTDLAGTTIPYEDSPLHQAAKDLVAQGEAEAKPLDKGFKRTRPGSPALNARLDFLANPNKAAEAGEEETPLSPILTEYGTPQPSATATPAEEPEPIDLDINELLARRKELGEQLRNTGWSTDVERQDRGIYKRLIRGVDDTIDQLAQTASENPDNPNAANILPRYRAINNAYRLSSRVFENKDVQAILEGRNNDVMQRLMSGGTSLNDINAVKQAFGDQVYHRFATDALQRFVADSIDDQGNVDYKGLLKKWNRIKPEVQDAAFGKFSSDTFNNVLNGAVGADEKLRSVNKTLADLMTTADPTQLVKSPERLNELEAAIGPDALSEIGQSIVQSEIRKASTTLGPNGQTVFKFDPDKFLSWIMSMKDKPEVADKLFRATPETQAKFDKLLKSVADVRTQKRLNALGIGTGSTVAGIAAAPAHAFSTILGMMVGAHEVSDGSVRQLLDRVANSPALWKALGFVSKVAKAGEKPVVKAAAVKTGFQAAKGLNAYHGVYSAMKGALGGGQ